jgi:repressor LexA
MGELVAIAVRGDALLPRYSDGDIIFYRPGLNDQKDVFLSNECVVAVHDGRIFVRKVLEGSRLKLFTLVAPNAVEMTNVSIQWAEPVRWVRRAVGKS